MGFPEEEAVITMSESEKYNMDLRNFHVKWHNCGNAK